MAGTTCAMLAAALMSAGFRLEVRQLTFGPKNHFFGYIGHVKNIPWNGDGRYIVALRTGFQDRMPAPADAAEVVLVDTRRGDAVTVIDRTRAWNFQQGTMFQVLYDVGRGEVLETIGDSSVFPRPGGDVALSPDGRLLVNGYRDGQANYYVVFRRADGAWARTDGFSHPGRTSGDLRVDGSPNWNRVGDQILFPGIAGDAGHTRQLFLIRILPAAR